MTLLLAILLILATFSTRLASSLGVPGLIVFLALGMIFGSDGLKLINFNDPILAQQIAIAALVVILFEGGFNTKKKLLKKTLGPSMTLATLGVLITAVVLGLMSHWFLGLSLPYAMLVGSIISSTDAAAVFALFRNKNIEPKIAATLEIESAANDPMAIILTVTAIQFIQGQLTNPGLLVLNLCWQLAAGSAIGALIGLVGPKIFNRARLDTSGFYYVLIFGLCVLSYSLADLIQGNGFLAVFITGYFLGNADFVYKQGLTRFIEGIGTTSHVVLFLMLGLLVNPGELLGSWKQGVLIALFLIFVARPVVVFLITSFWDYSFKGRVFMCWGGLKGAVPIVLGTYPLVAGLPQGRDIFNVVFFVVLLSALVQGATMDLLAKKLGLLQGTKRTPVHTLELVSLAECDFEMLQFEILPGSHLAGKTLEEISLPKDSLITVIVRKQEIVTPRGDTSIMERDLLHILVHYEQKKSLLSFLEPQLALE